MKLKTYQYSGLILMTICIWRSTHMENLVQQGCKPGTLNNWTKPSSPEGLQHDFHMKGNP